VNGASSTFLVAGAFGAYLAGAYCLICSLGALLGAAVAKYLKRSAVLISSDSKKWDSSI